MGFYGKAFDNGLQAKAAGSKPILSPANQNLGRSGERGFRGGNEIRDFKIGHYGRLGRLDAYTGGLRPWR